MEPKSGLYIEYLPVDYLQRNGRNARRHGDYDVTQIMTSIEKYGFNDPIGVWSDHNVIVEGHGRLEAAIQLGMDKVPCIRLDHLTDEQRREYGIMHNKTAELSEWDWPTLELELDELDLSDFDIDFGIENEFEYGDMEKAIQNAKENGKRDEEYEAFEDKFKPKLTTDDCFTPPLVYEAAKDWAVREYGWQGRKIIRPFYPGGDYQKESYPDGCVVIDNPPFSIISEIARFYADNGIDYFLFAPHLTCLCIRAAKSHLACGVGVIYDNGANVSTAFIASQGAVLRSAPTLYATIKEAVSRTKKESAPSELPNYIYPQEVMLSTRLEKLSHAGIEFDADNAEFIRALDIQKEAGKGLFGAGYLISSTKAAEAAEAAEAAKAIVWELSDREKAIIAALDAKE